MFSIHNKSKECLAHQKKFIQVEGILCLAKIKIPPSIYFIEDKSIAEEYFSDSNWLQDLLDRIPSLNPQNLPSLEELNIRDADVGKLD